MNYLGGVNLLSIVVCSAMYYNYLGGVIAVNRENVFEANVHSNDYWGWGNEDDDFNARCV